MPKCHCSGIRWISFFYGWNKLILEQPFVQILARSSALIGPTSVTRRDTVELLHCWARAVCENGEYKNCFGLIKTFVWLPSLVGCIIIRRHLQITPCASAVWDMCVLEGLFFWALLQLHPVLCDEHELHAKPSLELHRLHKVTKIKARLALNIPQNSVLNLHEIGLPYITAVWWNPLRLRGILISCCRRAHSSTFQGNLFSDRRGSFTLNGTSSHDQTM